MNSVFFKIALLLVLPLAALAQQPRLYTADGKPATTEQLLAAVGQVQLVAFGEQHGNPHAHALQLQLWQHLVATQKRPGLAMEQIERDQQPLLVQYLKGKLTEEQLGQQTKLWKNWQDYAPMVRLAREKKLPVTGTNVPRKYARMVAYNGLEMLNALGKDVKAQLAPLPIPLNLTLHCYSQMMDMVSGHGESGGGMSGKNFASAQAIKDATMGWFTVKALPAKGNTLLHLNGAWHTDNREGILWYVNKYSKKPVKTLTITTIQQEDPAATPSADDLKRADFILVTPVMPEEDRE